MAQIDITNERAQRMFMQALMKAEPGDEIVYHIGQYAAGVHKADALAAADGGQCFLTSAKSMEGLPTSPRSRANEALAASDPIGMVRSTCPDSKTRAAYGKACRDAFITSAAKHAINLPTLDRRRELSTAIRAVAREALEGSDQRTMWRNV